MDVFLYLLTLGVGVALYFHEQKQKRRQGGRFHYFEEIRFYAPPRKKKWPAWVIGIIILLILLGSLPERKEQQAQAPTYQKSSSALEFDRR